MDRRSFLQGALGISATTTMPRHMFAQAGSPPTLRFIPQSDLSSLDPMLSTTAATRNYAFIVYDTLFGLDDRYEPQPQMLERYTVEDNGLVWQLFLRSDLHFHDGSPVRARDAVASIKRWASRDSMGRDLISSTADLVAVDDVEIEFRLKEPFPLLPEALGKTVPPIPVIVPERLALQDATKPMTDVIGSGPFRFVKNEQVSGARLVYERFDQYAPRKEGTASGTAGPKRALLDRIEWVVITDPSTAAAALKRGEVDWWEQPHSDLLPSLRLDKNLEVSLLDRHGSVPMLRFNCLHPPFDNPAIRFAVMKSIDRKDVMRAVAGDDDSMWNDRIGIFTLDTPLASDAGLEQFDGPTDLA